MDPNPNPIRELGNFLALFYQDANVEVPPPAMVDVAPAPEGPNLTNVNHIGTVRVPGRALNELNTFLGQLPDLGYNEITITELCNHPARMLFKNLMEEDDLILFANMRPLRKEIKRVFFRLMTEEEDEERAFGWENVKTFDLPYRSNKFVQMLWESLGIIYEDNFHLVAYWQQIMLEETLNVELDVQFGLNEEREDALGRTFAEIIDERRVQREQN